ncbi:Glyoxalase/bleomycin resistance protein/dioxygenase [Paenibacillus riograndensis SBR5]|uniref:Glyoxalase/bleomycin resistance protein/dioxygenase n=2 Tax=Paenibacillus riograndensis TaxID=483937 RepID=A0A0E4HEG2_9BACL|nr:Glyoxalase/bleomycin resistance protein/dioxygenase [Paenibacillus riograndensis SBR5]
MGMGVKLEGITILALDVPRLTSFYRDVLGFKVLVEEDHYTEFENNGVRLAIFEAPLMADNTNGHHSFVEERRGQAFELNFECDSPEEVYIMYDDFVSKGATGITAPKVMSWGHTTGFFADPEGNIHSLFAVNPITPENA